MAKKVVIGGCRDYADYVFFKSRIDEILKGEKDEIIIISGHCSGIDLMGERYAEENGFKVEIFCRNGKNTVARRGRYETKKW